MLLIYTPRITKRKKYIFDLLIYNLCGFKFEITDNYEHYLNSNNPKFNYSTGKISKDELFFFSYGFLDEKGVKPLDLEPAMFENVPTIFPSGSKKSSLPYDPFSAAFFFVSRYEEYLPFVKDEHGRFEANQSFAYKNGFLEKPLVNHYALHIKKLIGEKYPALKPDKENSFSFIPTYDVDVAYAFKAKGLFRTIGGYLKSIFEWDIERIKQRTSVLAGKKPDPFDTFSFQLELSKKHRITPCYFFLVGDYGAKDKNPSVNNIKYQKLIKTLGDYAITGIHPSYASNRNPEKLNDEIGRLSYVLNREIKHSRQHYLYLELPITYQRLIQADINYDFTMGFASHTGFRAGICSPFLFYDLKNESITSLLIYPLTVMDGTLKAYMKLNARRAREKVKKLIDEVYLLNGTFVTLWHNDSLCNCGQWKGWKELYREIFEYAAGKMSEK